MLIGVFKWLGSFLLMAGFLGMVPQVLGYISERFLALDLATTMVFTSPCWEIIT